MDWSGADEFRVNRLAYHLPKPIDFFFLCVQYDLAQTIVQGFFEIYFTTGSPEAK
ncbi:hypothetical protein PLANPX_2933 [Lacipirellula parvula]|uniref:Uncharacterized protein n=1 Tax=Lacipirellula parvula TaxID=2650471 RepID=A0A5K7XEM2_9BACT|nr:hypothetical protein PLANPX_2933 [Lacipirellula parvula]